MTQHRVLIVEDDHANRVTLAALLADEGYAVETAASCADASRRIENGPACSLVVLDYRLGDGVGTDLLSSIRARWQEAKVLVVTGDDGVEASRFDGVVAKGGDVRELLAKLASMLGR